MFKSANQLLARVVLAVGIVVVLPAMESCCIWLIVDRSMDRPLLNTVAAILVLVCGMVNGEHLVREMCGLGSFCEGRRLWRFVLRGVTWMFICSVVGVLAGFVGHWMEPSIIIPLILKEAPTQVSHQIVGLIYLAVPCAAALLPVLIGAWMLRHTLIHYENYGPLR